MRQSPKSHLLRSSEHGHLPQDNSEAARNDVPSSEPKKRAPCSLIFTQMKSLRQHSNSRAIEALPKYSSCCQGPWSPKKSKMECGIANWACQFLLVKYVA
jgi:hypothetical protein